jgi:hypothetical protein
VAELPAKLISFCRSDQSIKILLLGAIAAGASERSLTRRHPKVERVREKPFTPEDKDFKRLMKALSLE